MENDKKLYNKNSRSLEYFLNQSKNPQMLLRWSRHFILTIVPHEYFLLDHSCNDLKLLFPDFSLRILSLLEKYSEIVPKDVPGFFETFRSNKRQYKMYSEGHSSVKSYGMHYYGLAVDIINFKNGLPRWNLDYDTLIRLANQIGITSLRPFEDCHFQFIPVTSQNDWREFARYLTLCIQDLLNVKQDGIIGVHTQGQVIVNYHRLNTYFNDIDKLLKKNYVNN